MGHSLGVHCTNPDIIMEFGLQKKVSRIIVNAPTSQGAVGIATNLVPSLTLGCGTPGGNITSDNISAHHLFNIKRVTTIKHDFPLWGKARAIESDILNLNLLENMKIPYTKFDKVEEKKKSPFELNLSHTSTQIEKKMPDFQEKQKLDAWEVRNYKSPSWKPKNAIRWP